MQMNSVLKMAVAIALGASLFPSAHAQTANDQSVETLRNTLVNVLEALVQKGVLTREQAQSIVADAQAKADASAKAKAAQEESEKNAVIVARIPESVKQDIVQQVDKDVRPLVTQDVLAEAKSKQWGVPGALPEWVSNVKLFGDVRVRVQNDAFAPDNVPYGSAYYDYLTINSKGGIEKAETDAYLNTNEDRLRARLRLRFGMDAKVADNISAGVRLASGNSSDPNSTNQTLGQYGARFQLAIDQAFLKFDWGSNKNLPWMTLLAGRTPNPYLSTDLVFDPDLNFDGAAATVRGNIGSSVEAPRNLFLTLGAHPLQEVELSSKDKWLYSGQLGLDWPWAQGARLRIGAAYYYYDNITGKRNELGSHSLDYTAPKWMQKGNTLFDINNDIGKTTTSANLFALAAEYHLADATVSLELPVLAHKLLLTGDYVRNVGYDAQAVLAQPGVVFTGTTSTYGKKRVTGYQGEIGFGSSQTGVRGSWRSYLAYRYLQRDAVLDAFTDSDFHLGGTDAKGYTLRGEWWFVDRASLALRYISSDSIDNLPFGIDTIMLDINGQF